MTFTEPEYYHIKLARTAKTLSFIAIITALLQTVIFPYILGGLSIIFAVISKGRNKHYQLNAKLAILISVGVLFLNTLFVGITTYNLFFNEAFKEQLNTTTQELYNMDFDEYVNQIYGAYGIEMN